MTPVLRSLSSQSLTRSIVQLLIPRLLVFPAFDPTITMRPVDQIHGFNDHECFPDPRVMMILSTEGAGHHVTMQDFYMTGCSSRISAR